MRLTALALSILCSLAILACAPMKLDVSGGALPGKTVEEHAKVLIMAIPDGGDERGAATGSGWKIHRAVQDAHRQRGIPFTVFDTESLAQAFEEAESLGCRYVLRAAIPEWHDHDIALRSKPSVIELSFELYGVRERSLTSAGSSRIQHSFVTAFVPLTVVMSLSRIYGWKFSEND